MTEASLALTLSMRSILVVSNSSVNVLLVAIRVARLASFDGLMTDSSAFWAASCFRKTSSNWATAMK